MRDEQRGHTLSPTALVNEAYLRLYSAEERSGISHSSFQAAAARSMRQILVDYARAKKAGKRGGNVSAITLHENIHSEINTDIDILALNDALDKLAASDTSKVQIVEMRYFSGMTLGEIAVELEISVATVKRRWVTAKAWLFREISS